MSDIINISLFLEDFSKCLKSSISCLDFKVKICKIFLDLCAKRMSFPGGTNSKEPACQCSRHETRVLSLDWEGILEEGMATHSSILAWRIPWIEEPGGLQSITLQRVRHYSSDLARTCTLKELCRNELMPERDKEIPKSCVR